MKEIPHFNKNLMNIKYVGKDDGFYTTLKQRVNDYFKEKNLSQKGNLALYTKTILFLSIWLGIISLFFSGHLQGKGVLFFSGLLFGITLALIGFNIMHDASHEAYDSKKWINSLFSHTLSIMGAFPLLWAIKHRIIHHSFVNTSDDDDIQNHKTMRFTPDQKWLKIHKWQHIYAPLLYCFLYFFWITTNDFIKYFKKKIKNKDISKSIKIKDHITFWIIKIVYVSLFLVGPFIIYGIEALWFLIPQYSICGLLISLVFQLAHINTYATFEKPKEKPGGNEEINRTFAEHQLLETIDFGVNNKVLSWFLGGLNFQAIHHLLPWISHVHYRSIQYIVIQTCSEFKKNYIHVSTWDALKSHFKQLKNMGKNP